MIHAHHRKRRSQGGDDSPTNVIYIPSELHTWIHENPERAYELGLLVKSFDDPSSISITIPDDVVQVKRPRKPRESREGKRNKQTYTIKVPVDERENGAEILAELNEMCRKELVSNEFAGSWSENVPMYYVDVAVKYDWLTSRGVTPPSLTKEE